MVHVISTANLPTKLEAAFPELTSDVSAYFEVLGNDASSPGILLGILIELVEKQCAKRDQEPVRLDIIHRFAAFLEELAEFGTEDVIRTMETELRLHQEELPGTLDCVAGELRLWADLRFGRLLVGHRGADSELFPKAPSIVDKKSSASDGPSVIDTENSTTESLDAIRLVRLLDDCFPDLRPQIAQYRTYAPQYGAPYILITALLELVRHHKNGVGADSDLMLQKVSYVLERALTIGTQSVRDCVTIEVREFFEESPRLLAKVLPSLGAKTRQLLI